MEQQLPVAVRIVARGAGLVVRGDVRPHEPELAVAHVAVRALEVRLPRTERLHLCPGEHETGLEPVEQVVVVPRAAVLGDQLLSSGHLAIVGSPPGVILRGPTATGANPRTK